MFEMDAPIAAVAYEVLLEPLANLRINVLEKLIKLIISSINQHVMCTNKQNPIHFKNYNDKR